MAGPVFLPLPLVHWTVKSVWSVSGVLATWLLWRLVWSLLVKAGFDSMCSLFPPTNSPCLSVLDLAPSSAFPPAPIVVGWPRLLRASPLLHLSIPWYFFLHLLPSVTLPSMGTVGVDRSIVTVGVWSVSI